MRHRQLVLAACFILASALALTLLPEMVDASPGSQSNTQAASSSQALGHSTSSATPKALETQSIDGVPNGSSFATQQLPLPAGSQLTLKDAISIALKYHPRATEAAAESRAAQEQVGEARSYLGPQLSGVTEYLRSTNNGIGNTSYYNPYGMLPRFTGSNHDLPSSDTSQSWDSSNNYAGGFAISQYLFDFGRRRGFVTERRFEAAATEEQQQLVDLDLVLEVSQRYFDLLKAKQLVRVFEKAVEERQFHLHEAQVKAEAGLRPQLDMYVTEAEVERAQLHLVDARNSEADALVAFDNSLGLGGESPNYQLVDVLYVFEHHRHDGVAPPVSL